MSTPTSGRRVAVRQRPRPDRSALLALVFVVLGGLLVAAAGAVRAQPEASPRPATVAVDQTAAACLASPKRASSSAFTLAAPLPQQDEAALRKAGQGTLPAGAASGQARPVTGDVRGRLKAIDAAAPGSATSVTATGGSAVGRSSFQVDRASGAGLAVQECMAPRSRWWFTGGGAGLDHQSTLVLANVDPGPAVVDVIAQGPDGVADDVGTRGITMAPGEVRSIDLVDIAPQANELSVHVQASRGRVVAGLADGFATTPGADPGRDWVPAQAEPSRDLLLTPLSRQADRRTLVVSNPTDREALVELKVSGASGAFVPTQVKDVRVPPQSLVTAELGSVVGRDASAVLLHSGVPVTAAVRSTKGADVSYAAAAPLLDGPAAAVVDAGVAAEVHLTAGKDGGTATATAYSTAGHEVDSAKLRVKPTTTLAWSPKGKAAYIVVSPARGDLAGGVTLEGGAGISQVPLQPLPVLLRQPVVEPVVN